MTGSGISSLLTIPSQKAQKAIGAGFFALATPVVVSYIGSRSGIGDKIANITHGSNSALETNRNKALTLLVLGSLFVGSTTALISHVALRKLVQMPFKIDCMALTALCQAVILGLPQAKAVAQGAKVGDELALADRESSNASQTSLGQPEASQLPTGAEEAAHEKPGSANQGEVLSNTGGPGSQDNIHVPEASVDGLAPADKEGSNVSQTSLGQPETSRPLTGADEVARKELSPADQGAALSDSDPDTTVADDEVGSEPSVGNDQVDSDDGDEIFYTPKSSGLPTPVKSGSRVSSPSLEKQAHNPTTAD